MTSRLGFLALALLAAGPAGAPAGQEDSKSPAIALGEKLPLSPTLRDLRGSRRSLDAFKGCKAFVIAFLGVRCPLSNLYVPRLVTLEAQYRVRGVKFVGVYPNESESLDQIAAHADERDAPFLVLKDIGQKLAARLKIERTPAVALLDGGLVLRYRGRIDDQYGAAYRKEKPEREDLVRALEELLEDKPVSVPETGVDGCLLGRESALPQKKGVTFSRNVAPILQRRCQACHRPGQIGPFPLQTYEQAVESARMIREVVVQRRMPPWHADERYGKFANDRRLTLDEIATIKAWAESGMPQGEPKDLPPPAAWPEGWTIGKPDLVLTLPKEMDVPAEGVMPYIYLTTKTGFTEDRWVQRAEVRPGDPGVVHHVLVYVRRPGQDLYERDGTSAVLAGWAPGDTALINPPGVASPIPKDAEIVWEVHYTPKGKATKDRTSLGLIFAPEPPKRELRVNIFARLDILIPPRDPHYRREHTIKFDRDVRLVSLLPHMHRRGKSYRYEATYPDGRTEALLSVPRWDFNWQSNYWFAEPLRLPKGTVLRQIGHWDNSDNNPLNPDPGKRVMYGLQTFQEMFNGWVQYVYDDE